jgi:hypothetical protein
MGIRSHLLSAKGLIVRKFDLQHTATQLRVMSSDSSTLPHSSE